jgi:Fic family protein
MYIYQQPDWPTFEWDAKLILPLLSEVRNKQGRLIGQMGVLGFDLRIEANLEVLTLDVLKSSEIEGKNLYPEQVRSSIARRLGLEIAGMVPSDRHVDGVVQMMLDATEKYNEPLTEERLFGWHASLFPGGYSGIHRIEVGCWRTGPMQVVSGPMGKETVHYEAPEAAQVAQEMQQFLTWFNADNSQDPVIKSAIAHFWFVTVHPFDDGNGRIARAIADMQLARADGQSYRFYSMSSQIRKKRNAYYQILEKTQKGLTDITEWILWFLHCLNDALNESEMLLENILFKHRFWQTHGASIENERQRKVLNRLLDGFEGKLTTSKWAKLCKCSQDTALRDIQQLVEQGVLIKLPGGGRSTGYDVNKKLIKYY